MKILNIEISSPPDLTAKGFGKGLVAVMAVLTQSEYDETMAVYVGIVDNQFVTPDSYEKLKKENANKVANHGVKQTYKKALQYFPTLPEEKYTGD